MSDKEIRAGLRYIMSHPPELLAEVLGVIGARNLQKLSLVIKNFAEHENGKCRHCYPYMPLAEEIPLPHGAGLSSDGRLISHLCKAGDCEWCSNRNWTETHCSCECHCFIKKYRKEHAGT